MTSETTDSKGTVYPKTLEKTVKALGWNEVKKGVWVKLGKKYDIDFKTSSTNQAKLLDKKS